MKEKKILFLAQAAVIAALYVVLLEVFAPISFQYIQVRVAEGLSILPFFTPAAIPGLFIGCLLGNMLGGAIPIDVVFGSLATLAGAIGTYAIGCFLRKKPFSVGGAILLPLPPILANTIVVPFVLYYGYGVNLPIPFQMLTVGAGEVISCGMIGLVLFFALRKHTAAIFRTQTAR